MKLNVKAFALMMSLITGIGLFGLTWWIMLWDGPTGDPTWVGTFYRGYNISVGGAFVGLLWGLADGAFGGAVMAWVYNKMVDWVAVPNRDKKWSESKPSMS